MESLVKRIQAEGRSLKGGILKVDSFINHQLDPNLMMEVGKEFVRLFGHLPINKIVTIEASGIAPAIMTGYLMQVRTVFIKKKQPNTLANVYVSSVHSFTRDQDVEVCINSNFLTPDDHILFIDDFLAYGNTARCMIDLAKQSGATIEGMGFCIEKTFQKGGEYLTEQGINFHSLACVTDLETAHLSVCDEPASRKL